MVIQYKTKTYFNLVLQKMYILSKRYVNIKFSNELIPYRNKDKTQ